MLHFCSHIFIARVALLEELEEPGHPGDTEQCVHARISKQSIVIFFPEDSIEGYD
jgi:hypothetical protein